MSMGRRVSFGVAVRRRCVTGFQKTKSYTPVQECTVVKHFTQLIRPIIRSEERTCLDLLATWACKLDRDFSAL